MQRHRVSLALLALALVATVASCSPSRPAAAPTAVAPTKTPKPTFTPTVAPTLLPIRTATQIATQAPTQAPATATPEATQVPPTSTPQPLAQFTANQTVNVRQGPSTAYPTIGQVTAGDNYKVTGKNADGTWYQFNYQGDPGWVIANLVTAAGDMDTVQVAQNIAPPPTAVPVPVVVRPTQPPAPPAPPPSQYKYSRASVAACRPQAGGTWFNGYVKSGGQPVDGEYAVFSWAPDAAPVAAIQVGPHDGYPGWDHGYFSHIISVPQTRAGDWYVWIRNSSGQRISEIAKWHSDGAVPEGTGCNDATINFEG
jgi:uncharacterized protein YraI